MAKKTILLQAAPFCYGPISTTLNVARVLGQFDHRLLAIEEGPTGELVRRSGFRMERVAVPTCPLSQELLNVIDQADLVVSNTDPVFAAACLERGARVVVLDTLFWMWDKLDSALLDCELYIVQDFYGVDEQVERLGRPRNFLRVGPLVRPQDPPVSQTRRENLIHVSLGGCDCLLVDPAQDPYPATILESIKEVLTTGSEIVLSTGERTARSLEPRDNRFKVSTLSNRDHLEVMRRAKAILLSPGLTGTMEVLEAETPVFFLPPQNYSQVLQLKAYRKASAAPFSFTWSDVYPEFDLPFYLPEEEAVNRVREVVGRFVRDPEARGVLRQKLAAFLDTGFQDYDPGPGKKLRRSLGMGGAEKAARAINALLVKD